MCKITYYVWNKIIQGSLSRSVWKKFLSLEKFYTHIVANVADYYEVWSYITWLLGGNVCACSIVNSVFTNLTETQRQTQRGEAKGMDPRIHREFLCSRLPSRGARYNPGICIYRYICIYRATKTKNMTSSCRLVWFVYS